MSRQLHLNGFEMSTVSHISHGLWRHPDSERERYKDIEYWIETAQLLERGFFDAIFLADVLGTSDVYEGSRDAAVQRGIQIPNLDPFLVVPAMLASTQHLGMALTVSTTYEQPYPTARRLSTLDQLGRGRLAWNVVTGYLPDAAGNFGTSEAIVSGDRYAVAEEFLEASYKLWEGSWEHDAVVADKLSGVYARPDKVREVHHHGEFFTINGPHLAEPTPQRTPVIFQAGTSSAGKGFAARHAEAVFVASQTRSDITTYALDIRARADEAGRGTEAVRIFAQASIVVAETEREAIKKRDALLAYRDSIGYLVHHSGISGIDLSGIVEGGEAPGAAPGHSAGYIEQITDRGRRQASELLEFLSNPERDEFLIVGDPGHVADELQSIAEESAIDGFNIVQHVSPGSFADVVDLLVPELQSRGVYRTEYCPGETLRERLFSGAGPYLPESHPGSAYRHNAPGDAA